MGEENNKLIYELLEGTWKDVALGQQSADSAQPDSLRVVEEKRLLILGRVKRYLESDSGKEKFNLAAKWLSDYDFTGVMMERLVENYVLARGCDQNLSPDKYVSGFLGILQNGTGKQRIKLSARLRGLSDPNGDWIPGQLSSSEVEVLRVSQGNDTYRVLYFDEHDDSVNKEILRWIYPLGVRRHIQQVIEIESDIDETTSWRGVHDEKTKRLMLDKARKFVGALVLADGDGIMADVALLEPVGYHPYFYPHSIGKVFDNSEFDLHADKRIGDDDVKFVEKILPLLLDDTQADTSTAFGYLLGSYEWRNDLDIKNVLLVSALEKLLTDQQAKHPFNNGKKSKTRDIQVRLPILIANTVKDKSKVRKKSIVLSCDWRHGAVHYQKKKSGNYMLLRRVRGWVRRAIVASISLNFDHSLRIQQIDALVGKKRAGLTKTIDNYGWRS